MCVLYVVISPIDLGQNPFNPTFSISPYRPVARALGSWVQMKRDDLGRPTGVPG